MQYKYKYIQYNYYYVVPQYGGSYREGSVPSCLGYPDSEVAPLLWPSTSPGINVGLHFHAARAALLGYRRWFALSQLWNKNLNNDIRLQDNDIIWKVFNIELILTQK